MHAGSMGGHHPVEGGLVVDPNYTSTATILVYRNITATRQNTFYGENGDSARLDPFVP